jgi:hypothetical protein
VTGNGQDKRRLDYSVAGVQTASMGHMGLQAYRLLQLSEGYLLSASQRQNPLLPGPRLDSMNAMDDQEIRRLTR